MDEASKAAKRRRQDWHFVNRWLVGRALDACCGNDPIKVEDFPKLTEVVPYDAILKQGADAQFLKEIGDSEFDVVHSSHGLEHLRDPRAALTNWIRVLKPGGFIVCTIPEEFLYECGLSPSRWNADHRLSFTMRTTPIIPSSVNVPHLLWKLPLDVEKIQLISEHWDPLKNFSDQTLGEAECCIEFVARKPHPSKPW